MKKSKYIDHTLLKAYAKEIELFEQYQDYFNSATYDLAYGD